MAAKPSLLTARTAAEIIEGVARGEWWEAHNKAECPPSRIPDPDSLAAWMRSEWPAGVGAKTIDRVLECTAWARTALNPHEALDGTNSTISAVVVGIANAEQGAPFPVISAHALWLAAAAAAATIDGVERPPHPLTAIVQAWQRRPQAVAAFQPKARASLPRLHRMGEEAWRLLDGFPGDDPPAQQLALPGFSSGIAACPSWLLWMYDRAGGDSMKAGRGAPWDMHLFIAAMLHLAVEQRDGQWKTLQFPHLRRHEANWPVDGVQSVEAWLFPDGWTSFRRDWHKLPEALHRMKRDLGYVPVPGVGSVATIFPSVIPETRNDPLVEFTIRIPTSAASGARIDWGSLRRYRLESAALYRAYLSAAAMLDHTAHHGHGITAEIAAPVLNPDATPKRRKGGAIVRNSTAMIPNRHARLISPLTDADLARLIGLDPTDKRRRHDARRALDRLNADGMIDLRKDRGGWRIFAPRRKA